MLTKDKKLMKFGKELANVNTKMEHFIEEIGRTIKEAVKENSSVLIRKSFMKVTGKKMNMKDVEF